MKPWILLAAGAFLIVAAGSSCSTTHSHRSRKVVVVDSKPLPPGQAKKITGAQSAKEYAPGQRKKKHRH